jgi:hypothetical protein
MPVDLLVDREDGQALILRPALRERASLVAVTAVDVDALRGGDGVDVALGVDRRPTPRAALDLQHRESVGPAVLGLGQLYLALGLRETLRADAAADPESDAEGLDAPGRLVLLTDELRCADQGRRALELLRGEQAERVAHQDGDTVAAIQFPVIPADRPLETSDGEREGRQTQVGLGLPTTGGEEQELDAGVVAAPVRVGGVHQRW